MENNIDIETAAGDCGQVSTEGEPPPPGYDWWRSGGQERLVVRAGGGRWLVDDDCETGLVPV